MNKTVVQFRGQARAGVPPGTRLNDLYEVDEQIAAGGMGEIYRGRMIETGDPVAIKMIKPEFADNESVLALFRKEASALNQLHHESIVRYYIFGTDRTINRIYLAMEFVEGSALSDILTRRSLTVKQTTELRQRLASGLQVAHDKGIIHRDISPDNIILPEEDVRQAKIIDFGIARSTKRGQATVIGDGFAGKYNYVSPEQLGMFGGDVTPRSDIYSLGLVLAECLRGKPIDMSGSQADVIEKRRQVPDLTGIDEQLEPLIARMLAPDPKDRPESMAEVVQWTWTPPATKQRAKTQRIEKPAKEPQGGGSKTPMIALAAALVVAAGGGGAFLMMRSDAPAPRQEATPALPSLPAQTQNPPSRTASALPEAPRAPPPPPLSHAERIANYVRLYDGDPCLHLVPVDVGDRTATIAAVAASRDAVRAFTVDFANVNGFDATVTSATMLPAQCPAIDFAHRFEGRYDAPAAVRLAKTALKPGEPANLTVANAAGRSVAVLVVDEDGSFRNLTPQLRPVAGDLVLDARLDQPSRPRPVTKLVLAVLSKEPLSNYLPAGDGSGRFPDLARELAPRGIELQVVPKAIAYE